MTTSHEELIALLDIASNALVLAETLTQRSEVIYRACVGFPPTTYGSMNLVRCKQDLKSFDELYVSVEKSKLTISLDNDVARRFAVKRARLQVIRKELVESVNRLLSLTECNGVLVDPVLIGSSPMREMRQSHYC